MLDLWAWCDYVVFVVDLVVVCCLILIFVLVFVMVAAGCGCFRFAFCGVFWVLVCLG